MFACQVTFCFALFKLLAKKQHLHGCVCEWTVYCLRRYNSITNQPQKGFILTHCVVWMAVCDTFINIVVITHYLSHFLFSFFWLRVCFLLFIAQKIWTVCVIFLFFFFFSKFLFGHQPHFPKKILTTQLYVKLLGLFFNWLY